MTTNFLGNIGLSLQAIGWVFMPLLLLPLLALILPNLKWIAGLQSSLIRIIDSANMFIAEWAKYLLVAMVVNVAFSVFALSIFGQSWTKLDELAIYFHASVIMLGSAATLLAGQHVRVDIFYAALKPKAKAHIDILGFYALLLPFCLIIMWNAQSFIGLAWASLEGSAESDGIRGVFLLKTMIGVFALTMLAQGFSIANRAALLLNDKDAPERPVNIDPLFPQGNHEGKL